MGSSQTSLQVVLWAWGFELGFWLGVSFLLLEPPCGVWLGFGARSLRSTLSLVLRWFCPSLDVAFIPGRRVSSLVVGFLLDRWLSPLAVGFLPWSFGSSSLSLCWYIVDLIG